MKTAVLLSSLAGLMLFLGYLLGGYSGLTIAFIIAIGFNFFSYWFSDKIVLAIYRAKPANKQEYKELHHMVEKISKLAGIPKPKVYILPSNNLNAFASGRSPDNAVVACTQGILQALNKEELEGVIAHEISHIKNRDILIQTIAATIAAVISYTAMMARWAAIFGGFGGRDRDSNIFEFLILAILMPILAMLIQLAISRSREYLADESAAQTLKSSKGLASALEKLEKGNKQHPMKMGNETTACLFISNPFTGKSILSLLSTHPPISKRVQKLKDISFYSKGHN